MTVTRALRLLYRLRLVVVLAFAVGMVAVGRTGSFVAGGADSYGFISEAQLFLDGGLHVRQDAMLAAPWPNASRRTRAVTASGSKD